MIKVIWVIWDNYGVTTLLPGNYYKTEQVWVTGQGVICNQGVCCYILIFYVL